MLSADRPCPTVSPQEDKPQIMINGTHIGGFAELNADVDTMIVEKDMNGYYIVLLEGNGYLVKNQICQQNQANHHIQSTSLSQILWKNQRLLACSVGQY